MSHKGIGPKNGIGQSGKRQLVFFVLVRVIVLVIGFMFDYDYEHRPASGLSTKKRLLKLSG